MDILIITVLIIAAVILFLVELFVIPGISLAGISALACILYANYYAMPKMISISLTMENVSFYSAISDILMVVPNIFLS